MLGDAILAEPGAVIGFAGPRVIKQTLGQDLPEGFQTAEFLLDHGMLDSGGASRGISSARSSQLLRHMCGQARARHGVDRRPDASDTATALDYLFARTTGGVQVRPRAHARAARRARRSAARRIPSLHVAGTNGKGSSVATADGAARARRGCASATLHVAAPRRFSRADRRRRRADLRATRSSSSSTRGRRSIERDRRDVLRGDDGDGVRLLRAGAAPTSRSIETGLGGRLDSTNVVDPARRRRDVDRARSHRISRRRRSRQIARREGGDLQARRAGGDRRARCRDIRGLLADARARGRRVAVRVVADEMRVDDVGRRRRRHRASRSRALGDERASATPLARAASGGELRVHARAARRGRRAVSRVARRGGARSAATRAAARALPARRAAGSSTSRTIPTARGRSRETLRCRRPHERRSRRCSACSRDKDWRAMMRRARARRRSRFVLTDAPTAPASRAWTLDEARAYARGARLRGRGGARLRRGARRARQRARDDARHRAPFTPSATRWRACRCLRSPGSFRGCSRAPSPAFATSIPRSSPSARTS